MEERDGCVARAARMNEQNFSHIASPDAYLFSVPFLDCFNPGQPRDACRTVPKCLVLCTDKHVNVGGWTGDCNARNTRAASQPDWNQL